MKKFMILAAVVTVVVSSCITEPESRTVYTSSGEDTLTFTGSHFTWNNCPPDYSPLVNIAGTWQNTTDSTLKTWPSDEFMTFYIEQPSIDTFTVLYTPYNDGMFINRILTEVGIFYRKIQ